eukprot:Rhum_TRINITY_DN10278_c0_g1::Rhum_TRINITY_DN10278_c0_g1_i1::g.37522::m.37522
MPCTLRLLVDVCAQCSAEADVTFPRRPTMPELHARAWALAEESDAAADTLLRLQQQRARFGRSALAVVETKARRRGSSGGDVWFTVAAAGQLTDGMRVAVRLGAPVAADAAEDAAEQVRRMRLEAEAASAAWRLLRAGEAMVAAEGLSPSSAAAAAAAAAAARPAVLGRSRGWPAAEPHAAAAAAYLAPSVDAAILAERKEAEDSRLERRRRLLG